MTGRDVQQEVVGAGDEVDVAHGRDAGGLIGEAADRVAPVRADPDAIMAFATSMNTNEEADGNANQGRKTQGRSGDFASSTSGPTLRVAGQRLDHPQP
jgi:hypothetical protein